MTFLNSIASVVSLVLNTVGFLFKNKTVAVFANNIEVLENCAIISCDVQEQSQIMEHPIEDGATIADFKVFKPTQITLKIALNAEDYDTEFMELDALYRNCEMLTVQTKTQLYENLQIVSIPHDERAATVDRLVFTIKLQEVQIVEAAYVQSTANRKSNTQSAENSKTVDVGQQQNSNTKQSVLKNIFGGNSVNVK